MTGNAHGVSRGSLPAHLRALSLQALRGALPHGHAHLPASAISTPTPPSTTASTPPACVLQGSFKSKHLWVTHTQR